MYHQPDLWPAGRWLVVTLAAAIVAAMIALAIGWAGLVRP